MSSQRQCADYADQNAHRKVTGSESGFIGPIKHSGGEEVVIAAPQSFFESGSTGYRLAYRSRTLKTLKTVAKNKFRLGGDLLDLIKLINLASSKLRAGNGHL